MNIAPYNSRISNKRNTHIKKPLNAFMLFMKEMRANVVAECTLKESAAINQILGRRVSFKLFILFIIKSTLKIIKICVLNNVHEKNMY